MVIENIKLIVRIHLNCESKYQFCKIRYKCRGSKNCEVNEETISSESEIITESSSCLASNDAAVVSLSEWEVSQWA